MRVRRLRLAALTLVLAAVLAAVLADTARGEDLPRLQTNEAEINEAARNTALAIDDRMAVFGFVLGSLPARVNVYPTENYYYFGFVHGGTPHAGNIRLAAADRDLGKLHFGYFQAASGWHDDAVEVYAVLDARDGVTVEKIEPLAYRVTYRDKSVVFALNDLSDVRPPRQAIGADERFIGPVFDESGVRFFLVYNTRLRIFHFVLDETVAVPDRLAPLPGFDRILIGRRTGFAFYREHRHGRKILIGAFQGNVQVNNYFDGPFDQIPENFIRGDAFRDALIAVEPDLKGRINQLGMLADGARYAITPYLHYRRPGDLAVFHRCATSRRVPPADYHACFVIEQGDGKVLPLAMQRKSR
jgi:hypothetical protein